MLACWALHSVMSRNSVSTCIRNLGAIMSFTHLTEYIITPKLFQNAGLENLGAKMSSVHAIKDIIDPICSLVL